MASSFSNNNGCCAWISTPVLLLLCIILFQWLLLTILLSRQETMNAALSTLHLGAAHCSLCPSSSSSKANSIQGNLSSFLRTSGKHADPLQQEWQGVAVGLLLRRPKMVLQAVQRYDSQRDGQHPRNMGYSVVCPSRVV